MTYFRPFVFVLLLIVAIYSLPVLATQGLDLLTPFFSDILQVGWPGQFNLDFLTYLTLSGAWIAWRHGFDRAGLVLGALAYLGMPYFATYLLVAYHRAQGDPRRLLLGVHAV